MSTRERSEVPEMRVLTKEKLCQPHGLVFFLPSSSKKPTSNPLMPGNPSKPCRPIVGVPQPLLTHPNQSLAPSLPLLCRELLKNNKTKQKSPTPTPSFASLASWQVPDWCMQPRSKATGQQLCWEGQQAPACPRPSKRPESEISLSHSSKHQKAEKIKNQVLSTTN